MQHTDGTLIAGGQGLADALEMSSSDVGSMAIPARAHRGPRLPHHDVDRRHAGVLVEAFALAEAVATYTKYGVTMAGGSTAFYQMFVAEQRKQPGDKVIPSLRNLSGGGAPMPPEVYRRCSTRSA